MNRDDDTLLSAYLDGQLDAEERHVVESAVVSNPELAEKLRSLTSLRDLVGSLNREFPIDVTARVIGRIRPRRHARSGVLPHLVYLRLVQLSPRAAVFTGIAAGLLLCIALAVPLLTLRYKPRQSPLVGQGSTTLPPRRDLVRGSNLRTSVDELDAAVARAAIEAAGDRSDPAGSHVLGRGAPSGDSRGVQASSIAQALEHYRQLLDNPNQRRLFRTRDGGDGKAVQQVASVLESTTRLGFYKITISQGIVIDPLHPGEATVFAALVSASDLDSLRDRLGRALPDRVDESPVDPAVVTQLADIGRVRAFPSAPFGDVLIPREGLALRTAAEAGEAVSEEPAAAVELAPTPLERPTIEQERSAPIGEEIAKRRASIAATRGGAAGARESEGALPPNAQAEKGAVAETPVRATDVPTRNGRAAPAHRSQASEGTFVVLVWVARSHHG